MAGELAPASLLPTLRDELAVYRARARFIAPDDFVFPTEIGERQNASNVRNRVLARSVERANRRLAERDLAPLPSGLTPHSLRRTYASLLIAKGDELPYVMENPVISRAFDDGRGWVSNQRPLAVKRVKKKCRRREKPA